MIFTWFKNLHQYNYIKSILYIKKLTMIPYIIILSLFIFLLIIYLFIILRLKTLNKRHIEHTWIEWIKSSYNRMFVITTIFMFILFIISSIIILTIY